MRNCSQINMGATAIGTGINSPPGYAALCTKRLAEISGLPVTLARISSRPRRIPASSR